MSQYLRMALVAALGSGFLATSRAAASPAHGRAPEDVRTELESTALILSQLDQRLARILSERSEARDPARDETLREVRKQANSLVFRITQVFDDGFPCQPTILAQPPQAARTLPNPDEYVPFDVAPQLVSIQPPRYTGGAREAKVEGVVLVRVLVGTQGLVERAQVIQSVPELDGAALESAWTAVFKPAVSNSEAVAIWMVVPIEFALH